MNTKIYNMLRLFIVSMLMLSPWIIFAQISREGVPPSYSIEAIDTEIQVIELTPVDKEAIAGADENLANGPGPYRIGKLLPVNVSIENAGIWVELPSGGRIWRLTIQSPGALGVSLYFDHFWLPEGGELYAYNAMRTQTIGAFTDFNNDQNGLFAFEIIQGESVTLEYYQPESVVETAVISISDMAYIFRGVSFSMTGGEDGERGSAWCMINVNCEEGDDWQEEKRGVVKQYMILPDGYVGWCSGSLINNTNWNLEPYVLSAHHCGEGCTPGQYNQWIFYFKYEAATCSGSSGPQNFSITGCSVKAEGDRYTGSDFALYLLNQDPPDSYDPYWNGWNRTNEGSPNGVSIHHPQGDIKKISTYTQPLTSSEWNNNGVMSHWKAIWAATVNGTSIVEGGSSGSPLFDVDHNIVGDLTGGPANQSCTNTSYSLYGKVYWSWDKMGSGANQQLKYWLDPAGTGADFLPGTEGVAPTVNFETNDPTVPPGTAIDFTDLSMGSPVEWSWSFPGGEPSTSSDKNPQNIVYNDYGSYSVTLTCSNPYGSDTETKTNYIVIGDAPIADFSADITEVVAGGTVYFYDESIKNPTSWSWQFEGGMPSASFSENPGPIYYNVPGTYQVKLVASNDFGMDTEIKDAYITVLGPPVANFSASQTLIAVGGSVDFTDLSSGDPTSWEWTFPGGTPSTSNEANPEDIVYNQAGSFNVTLEVTGDLGSDDTTMYNYITVVAGPTPNFTCPNRYIQAGTSTTFTDYSIGDPTSWYWEFEGGTPATSSQQDPGEIIYYEIGDYDVTLTVSNQYGSQSITKPSYIHVGDTPEADFTADKTFIAVGESISFSDLSANSPSSWNWAFEGGTPAISTQKNPANIAYNQVGIFDVTLTVTNAYGEDTEVKDNYVEVGYVGIDDQELNPEDITVYPNPTSGMITVGIRANLKSIESVGIYNLMGDRIIEVSDHKMISHQLQLDLNGNPPGIYYLNIKANDQVIIKKVTLSR